MYKIGNLYVITAIAVVGGGLFGFDISSMSAIISQQPYLCYFNQEGMNSAGECLGPRSAVQGGITAAMPGGSWLGALISGFISDRVGRKTAVQIGSVIWLIGSILCCATNGLAMLAIGRIINGFSVGICSAQVPVYISECAPPSKRGRLVGIQQWAITWGILIMFFIAYGCSYINSTASFRLPWGLQMIPAILLFLGLFLLPESPRWLAKHDRWEEAKDVLVLTQGKGDPNSPFVMHELEEIREVVEFERANADVSYLELFYPKMLNRTSIGLFTQIWSQLTGMNVMMYYITYVFTMAGLNDGGHNSVLLPSVIQYIINVFTTIPALVFMDSWGRRPMFVIGAFFMCLFMCCNAGIFAVYSTTPYDGEFTSASESMAVTGPPAKAIIACTYLFVASYAPSWGPASWAYPPELFPLRLRGKAVSFTTSGNWAFNFALAYFVPPALENIKWKTYVLFAVFCFAMMLHTFFFFPETANKPLEEVEEIFDDTTPGSIPYVGTPAWKTKNVRHEVLKRERNEYDEENKIGLGEHKETAVAEPAPAATTA